MQRNIVMQTPLIPIIAVIVPSILTYRFLRTFATHLALFVLFVSSAQAGHYELAQDNPAEGVIGYILDRDTCTAFLKNLREFETRPYGMACRRELDPKLGFTRPTWEKLDILMHIPLALAIIKFANWEATWLPKDTKLWEARIKQMVDKENLTMELTRLDLNGDGKPENLIRFGFGWPCDQKMEIDMSPEVWNRHRRLFVADETLARVDPYSGEGSFGFVQDNVILYAGRIYTDVFSPTPLELRAQRKRLGILELFHFNNLGATRICAFEYFNAARPQGGK